MLVPISCDQCGCKNMEYVFMAMYAAKSGTTRIAHDLACPDCSHSQKLWFPPITLIRTSNGIGIDFAVGRPMPR